MDRFIFLCVAVLLLICSLQHNTAFAQDARESNQRGIIAMRNGNYQEAQQLLLRAMKLEPEWAEPYYNASRLLRLLNKREDMRRALKKAAELEPSNPIYVDAYVKTLREDLEAARAQNNSAMVVSIRQDIITANPSEYEVGAEHVAWLIETGKKSEGVALARKIIDSNPSEKARYRVGAIGDLYYLVAASELESFNLPEARFSAERATMYPGKTRDKARDLLAEIKAEQRKAAKGHLKLGKSYLAKNQKNEALAEFQKGLEIDPEFSELKNEIDSFESREAASDLFARAQRHIREEKWLEARDLLERALSVDPSHEEAKKFLKQAEAFENKLLGRLGRAERLPRTSKEREKIVEHQIQLGQRFAAAKNFKAARVAFDRATAIIELDSSLEMHRAAVTQEIAAIEQFDSKVALYRAAIDARSIGDYPEVIAKLEKLPLDYMPPDARRNREGKTVSQVPGILAEAYWRTGKNDLAKKNAARQLSFNPFDNRAKFVLGNIYFEENNVAAAQKILGEIRQDDPDYPGLQGLYLKTSASYFGPLVLPILIVIVLLWIAYTIYIKLPEYNKNAAIRRARKFLRGNRPHECIQELVAVKRHPNLTSYDGALISRLLSQAYLKTGVYDKAVGEAKHLLAINPSDTEARRWLGFAFLGRRILSAESLPELMNLQKTETNNVALVSLLGQHFVAQKISSPEGIQIIEKWIELEPGNPEALSTLGRYYLRKGRSDDTAMKVFQGMMDTGKAEPEFVLGMSKMHLKLGNIDECLRLCEIVLSSDVNNDLVHGIMKEAYTKMGKIDELIEIYRAFLAENPYNISFQNGLKEALKAQEKAGGSSMRAGAPPSHKDEGSQPSGETVRPCN